MRRASQVKEEEEKEKKQQKERRRQFKLKLLLESYAQQKKEQEEFLRLEKEMREKTEKAEKRKAAAEEISRFQERVSQYSSRDMLSGLHTAEPRASRSLSGCTQRSSSWNRKGCSLISSRL